ncbi:hypothetical protein HBB16_21625 [Pseudonocardia sp. MCCB 268]|nr:hypothetical protein [Pseudonocardia cytotoxica]
MIYNPLTTSDVRSITGPEPAQGRPPWPTSSPPTGPSVHCRHQSPEPFKRGRLPHRRPGRGGDGRRTAVRSPAAPLTYAELTDRVRAVAGALRAAGSAEQRVLLVMADDLDLFTAILRAMWAGARSPSRARPC